ncbi:NADP-dependent oxidoreductase domain superfamily protein [Abortiporus biennis]
MSAVPKFKLNNGVEIPAVGLGCWSGNTAEEQASGYHWFLTALKQGYRHFDTAYGYYTEESLGKALRDSAVPREEIFVTTKFPWNHGGKVEWSINESLKRLGLEYVDLWLLHWPHLVTFEETKDEFGDMITVDSPTFNETWADMEKVYASGKAKAIGVSNFSIKNLEKLFTTAKVVPVINQVELHPYLVQEDLRAYCKEKGIILTAYAPTGYSTVLSDPTIQQLATKYNVQPAQIVLAWHVQRGVVAVPKSRQEIHQKQNITLPTLSEDDIKTISALDKGRRLCNPMNERGKVWGATKEFLGW